MKNPANQKNTYSVGKNWNNQKMNLKQNYQLTDSDLAFAPGKVDEMLERLEVKLNLNRENLLLLLGKIKKESETDGTTGVPF